MHTLSRHIFVDLSLYTQISVLHDKWKVRCVLFCFEGYLLTFAHVSIKRLPPHPPGKGQHEKGHFQFLFLPTQEIHNLDWRVKAVYCDSAYLTYMQSTSWETLGQMKHKLESRLLGKVSITSDMQVIHPYCRKWKRTKEPVDESEKGEWKSWA